MASSLSSIYGNYTNFNYSGLSINTSTERFKGTVTGYKPIAKSSSASTSSMTPSDTKEYLANIKEHSNSLKKAADKMVSGFPPVFEQMVAKTSNSDALTVTSDSNKVKSMSAMDVNIQQLATTQKNTGVSLNAGSKVETNTGTNRFTIETGGKTYDFAVNITGGDSNKSAQQKMADAINSKNIGLNAKVVYDEVKKESSLVIESKETGEKNGFTIRDKAGSGLVAATGADNTVKEASNAVYSVNGVSKTSATNTVDLGNGITATLKKANESATVETKQDTNGIINSIYDLVNSYNKLLETAKDNSKDSGAQTIIRQLTGITSTYSSSLSKIGISTNDSGYITINTDKLKSSVENGSAEKTLSSNANNSYGFVNRLKQVSSAIDANPNQYVSKSAYNATTSSSKSSNTSSSSRYDYRAQYYASQMTGIGLLLDSLF